MAALVLPASAWAQAEVLQLPITADNSIIDVNGERDFNMGAARSLRVKSFQHHLIARFDAAPLAGRTVRRATLVYGANAQADSISRVSVSTIQADWGEGDSGGFAQSAGGSTFNHARHPDTPWSWPGSTFANVAYGNSHSLHNESAPNLADGWFRWEVDPDLVHANAVGAAYGLAVMEADHDVGRNPTVHDRTHGQFAPYLEVELSEAAPAPGPVTELIADDAAAELGEVVIEFTVPADAFAYRIQWDGQEIPRHSIPFAGAVGSAQRIRLWGLGEPGDVGELRITAVSRSGSEGPAVVLDASIHDEEIVPFADLWPAPVDEPSTPAPEFAGLRVYAVPTADRVRADGTFVEPRPDGYRSHNPLFRDRRIKLRGFPGEVVDFVVVVEALGEPVSDIQLVPTMGGAVEVLQWRVLSVATSAGPIPELLYGPGAPPLDTGNDSAADDPSVGSMLVEVTLPSPQDVQGDWQIELRVGRDQLQIPIDVDVFAHPEALSTPPSFHADFNTYGWPSFLATFNEEQVLARRFKGSINTVPYGHGGRTRMDMIKPNGSGMDERAYNDIEPGAQEGNWRPDFFEAFDPWVGPEAAGGAASTFYLTFHENWPQPLNDHRTPGEMDADALPEIYGRTFTNVLRSFDGLAVEAGWDQTQFHVYLNNKPGGGRNPTPWELDEPSDLWDFKALDYFNRLTQAAQPRSNIVFRVDVSRPQYARGHLRDVDLYVCGGACVTYARMIAEQRDRDGWELWHYGSAAPVPDSLHHPQAWAARSVALGGNGIVPWQTVREGRGFLEGQPDNEQRLAVFIEAEDAQAPEVWPTLRAAAYRRAVQDMELLRLMQGWAGLSQAQLARFIGAHLGAEYDGEHWADYAARLPQTGHDATRFETMRRHATAVIERMIAQENEPDPGEGEGEGGEGEGEGGGQGQGEGEGEGPAAAGEGEGEPPEGPVPGDGGGGDDGGPTGPDSPSPSGRRGDDGCGCRSVADDPGTAWWIGAVRR